MTLVNCKARAKPRLLKTAPSRVKESPASNLLAPSLGILGTTARSLPTEPVWERVLEASYIDASNISDCEMDNESIAIMPANETVCLIETDGTPSYRLEGTSTPSAPSRPKVRQH